jgi:hypothetical protein
MAKRPDRIEIFSRFHGDAGCTWVRWYWRLRSNNGKIRAIGGEPFVSKSSAKRAAVGCFPKIKTITDVGSR